MIKPACENVRLIKGRDLGNNYFSLMMGPFSKASACRPGHFLHLKIASSEIFLRRAFSIAAIDADRQTVEIIIKIFGRGSRVLSQMRKGDAVGFLGPLGVPFKLPSRTEQTIMVAGGVGFPPLLFLATTMIAKGHDPKRIHFFYGGRNAGEIVERTRLKRLGIDFRPVTEDGTLGGNGLVTKPVEEFINGGAGSKFRMFGCGPAGMLKATDALARRLDVPGQISMEAPMPCGIGVCLGCVVPLTAGGHARVCHDGPVFDIGEVAL